MGDLGSIPELERPPWEGKGYPLQHSGLENSTDCIVHGAAKNQTQLSDFHFTFKIPGCQMYLYTCVRAFLQVMITPLVPSTPTQTYSLPHPLPGFPDGSAVKNLPAMQEAQETWVDPWVRKIPWGREWQPTPVLLPVEFHGHRSLAGDSPWGSQRGGHD